jgi:hypothetical protein
MCRRIYFSKTFPLRDLTYSDWNIVILSLYFTLLLINGEVHVIPLLQSNHVICNVYWVIYIPKHLQDMLYCNTRPPSFKQIHSNCKHPNTRNKRKHDLMSLSFINTEIVSLCVKNLIKKSIIVELKYGKR